MAERSKLEREFEEQIGHHFQSHALLDETLHAAGTAPLKGNKRLALVGDSVLSTMLLSEWYEGGGSTAEGQKILRDHACNSTLSAKGYKCNLDKYVIESPAQKGKVSRGTRASTVEATLGAVWLDSGKSFQEVGHVMHMMGIDAGLA